MSVSLKRTVITLACATAVSALISTPSLAGVITLPDKPAISTVSPFDSVYYGWCHRRYHHRHYCRAGYWGYPYYPYAYGYGYPYWGYPAGVGAAAVGASAGLLGLGLGIL